MTINTTTQPKRIIAYSVLSACDFAELDRYVNDVINQGDGWQPWGSPTVDAGKEEGDINYLYQAVVRYEE